MYQAFSESQQEQTQGAAKEILNYREALWDGYHYLSNGGIIDRDYFYSNVSHR
ncbi:hypothetical protein [Sphingobacterium multivorum]|uniref:hypothetical protein n=1 Tax=Sphingobacterium multivorum TaxID=28454 RepID=UPI001EF5C8A6|nr:hypothetical protein [Sphingobacterium multivorum]